MTIGQEILALAVTWLVITIWYSAKSYLRSRHVHAWTKWNAWGVHYIRRRCIKCQKVEIK